MFYEFCVLFVFPLCLIYAAISDAMSFTISNRVSLVLLIGFVALVPFSGLSMQEVGMHLLVGFMVLVIGFILFAGGYLGGGDVKIISTASLWLGVELVGPFLIYIGLFGGVLALSCLHIRQTPLPQALHGQTWLLNWQCGEPAIPYGIAIGLAGLTVYPQSVWLGLV